LFNEAGYQAVPAKDGEGALAQISISQPALVITELRLPDTDGLNLFDTIHQVNSTLPVIILTAYGSIPLAVAATQRGVFDFLTEPIDVAHLLKQVQAALGTNTNQNANLGKENAWREGIFTRSPQMENLISQASRWPCLMPAY